MTRLYLVRAIVSPDMGKIWFWLYEYVSLCARAYVCAEAQAPKMRQGNEVGGRIAKKQFGGKGSWGLSKAMFAFTQLSGDVFQVFRLGKKKRSYGLSHIMVQQPITDYRGASRPNLRGLIQWLLACEIWDQSLVFFQVLQIGATSRCDPINRFWSVDFTFAIYYHFNLFKKMVEYSMSGTIAFIWNFPFENIFFMSSSSFFFLYDTRNVI